MGRSKGTPAPKTRLVREDWEALFQRFHQSKYLSSDPIEFVWKYSNPHDQEVVALVAATLAYGGVIQIRRAVEGVLSGLEELSGGQSPSHAIAALTNPADRARFEKRFEQAGWGHRFNRSHDLVAFLEAVALARARYGSVGALFSKIQSEVDDDSTVREPLDRLMQALIEPIQDRMTYGLGYFFTAPKDGSTCKRWLMFLRWAGRRDELDPGFWSKGSDLKLSHPLRPEQLVFPLDTHTGALAQMLGLTQRKSLNWRVAEEVTAFFRTIDPHDPVRFDFALCRLGILDQCQKKFVPEICDRCELRSGCIHPRAQE
jgi:uncharacterized protein (TIGR02757 family)